MRWLAWVGMAAVLGAVGCGGGDGGEDDPDAGRPDAAPRDTGLPDSFLPACGADFCRPGEVCCFDCDGAPLSCEVGCPEILCPPDDAGPPTACMSSADCGFGQECCPFTNTCFAAGCDSCCIPPSECGMDRCAPGEECCALDCSGAFGCAPAPCPDILCPTCHGERESCTDGFPCCEGLTCYRGTCQRRMCTGPGEMCNPMIPCCPGTACTPGGTCELVAARDAGPATSCGAFGAGCPPGQLCCAATGTCYDERCLSCCMPGP